MLKSNAFVLAGFVVITLVFGMAVANSAAAMDSNMNNHMHATYP